MSNNNKRKYQRLSLPQRGMAVAYADCGLSQPQIAEKLGCDQSTVSRLLNKVATYNTFDDLPRAGRPRKTSKRTDRHLKISSSLNRKKTAPILRREMPLEDEKLPCSQRTVRRRLCEVGLNGRVARKKPLLKKGQKLVRKKWATKYKTWTVDQWRKVLFSDESPFTLFQTEGHVYVRRRVGEELNENCLAPTVKHGGGKIQVWSCFSYEGVGKLYQINGIMDGKKYREILKNQMAPHLRRLGQDFIFQHDNDPKHTSKVAKNYLKNAHFVVLDWPSQSPDLNPIENLWRVAKKRMQDNPIKATSLSHLFELAKQAWESITLDEIHKIIDSMPQRIKAVLKARGGHTKY